jgi:hypothetical protein
VPAHTVVAQKWGRSWLDVCAVHAPVSVVPVCACVGSQDSQSRALMLDALYIAIMQLIACCAPTTRHLQYL